MARPLTTQAPAGESVLDGLRPRYRPDDERGRAAFDAILAASARLIEEGGIERLNTNLVAAESGVNISTVYKFFPNKLAIVATLFERQSAERSAVAFDDLDQLATAPDWAALVDRAVDRLVARRRSQPGHVALRRAMRSSPELVLLEAEACRRVAERLAALLRARTRLPRARSLVVARALVELQVSMLDWWESEEGNYDPGIVREFKAMARAYLAVYLDA